MNQANQLRQAVEAKRQDLIKLFKDMGYTKLSCGTPINTLTLTALQEVYKGGVLSKESRLGKGD